MKNQIENKNFHDYSRRLSLLLSRINSKKYGVVEPIRGKSAKPFTLTHNNLELINKYYVDIVNEGLTKPRILSLLDQTCRILEMLNKDWVDATVDDIKIVVNQIRDKDFSEHTKSDYLDKLKRFDKWHNQGEYSELTRRISTTIKQKYYKLPSQLITPQEAQKLVESAKNTRDRALIHILWETGARIGEIGNIKISDIELNKGECFINLYGKTGSRRVMLVESVRDLQNYLKIRNPQNQEEFLFLLIGTLNHGKPITYNAIQRILQRAVNSIELRKKVYPHLFRHSRASYLASKGLSEAQLCMVFGWQIGSKQVRTYIHLSQNQVQQALLEKVYNIKKPEEQKKEFIKCEVCYELNPTTNDTCQHCFNPLTIQGALKLKQQNQILEQDRDISQKVFAEAFKLMQQKNLQIEDAQKEAIKIIAQQLQQKGETK